MLPEHFDVLVIGAGLSGIGAGYHLQTECPNQRYAILEGRSASGGTWDLFRYPGVRSDSDMYTLGYHFRPWLQQQSIADGASILQYIRDTAAQYGIDQNIRYGHRFVGASWSSIDAQWALDVEVTDPGNSTIRRATFTCRVLHSCMGYYDYQSGFTPSYPGLELFRGSFVHPQQWPAQLDYRGKRVVVIGSGATAITLVPAMAQQAAHVTMLQRSPTYIMSRPSRDSVAHRVRTLLPAKAAYAVIRWKNAMLSIASYWVARRYPAFVKRLLVTHVRRSLNGRTATDAGAPDVYDVDTHFSPRYNPWDQRVCLAPDADFFKAVRSGTAAVKTATIDTFTRTGIRLTNGEELDADIIVSATGLRLRLLSNVQLWVDGVGVSPSDTMVYKGMMFSNIPNFVSAFGYTNASWTLKVDLTSQYLCRLLRYMDRHKLKRFTPRQRDPTVTTEPVLNFTSGYVQRALGALPTQGSKTPWRVHQNYLRDFMALRLGRLNDGVMEFG